MRKILLFLYVVVTTLISGLYVYSNYKKTDLLFYTLKEHNSYVYKENRRMSFNIYSVTDEPLILFPEKNSYSLKLDKTSFNLDNVTTTGIKNDDSYLVKIEADLPMLSNSEFHSDKCELRITNGSYSLLLNMGTFSYLPYDYYEPVKLDYLSGSYSLINGSNELVGINLKLSNSFSEISTLRIGGYAYGILSKLKFNTTYDTEIDITDYIPNYSSLKVEEEKTTGIKSNTMFIPIGYKNESFIRGGYLVFKMDGKMYYFDNFTYQLTNPSFTKYKDKMVKGEYTNA